VYLFIGENECRSTWISIGVEHRNDGFKITVGSGLKTYVPLNGGEVYTGRAVVPSLFETVDRKDVH
jgi:hypothetical protein